MAYSSNIIETSPTAASNNESRILDKAPPQPRSQTKQSALFRPPADAGMGEVGGDPMVQMMMAAKQIDMGFQKLAMLFPEAIDPLAQLQNSAQQLVAGLLSMQSQNSQQAPMIPTLPMQSGPVPGMQQGVGL